MSGDDEPGRRARLESVEDPGPDPTNGEVRLATLGNTTWPIVRVGIDKNKKMVVPRNARDVAWLDQGKWAGQTNNIVLAGHINWSGQDGSFKRIGELKRGHDIFAKMNGKSWHFKVTWNCTFPRETEYADQIMGYTDVPSVTLVSCGGEFNRAEGTHEKRIVVRAELYPPAKKKAPASSKPKPKKTPKPTPTPNLIQRVVDMAPEPNLP